MLAALDAHLHLVLARRALETKGNLLGGLGLWKGRAGARTGQYEWAWS